MALQNVQNGFVAAGSPVNLLGLFAASRSLLKDFFFLNLEPKTECLCDERLKTKAEESTRLAYTGFHLKICFFEIDKARAKDKTSHSIYECRCDERLKTKGRNLHASHTLGCSGIEER